ncbi:MAG: alpha-E domain-containing protein [Gammaproteobacteria bacterium]|nr:alpha-E domain-containing protein [Gammaproteobacteria bacterium]
MLSRVAENIYWIGRYLERAENTARLINVNSNLMLDLPKGIALGWEPMIRILGCEQAFAEKHDETTERRVVNFLISDEGYPGSILSTLGLARENARTIRDILPREAWEELNAFHQEVVETKQNSYARQGRHNYLIRIIRGMQQLTGLLAGTMNHDTAYHFLNMGRKLERADMTTRIINVKSENPIAEDATDLAPYQDTLWMSMLESLGAYQMYRQSMQVRINRIDVLTFLFRRTEFPRSFTFCIENIAYNLSCLPNNTEPLTIIRHIERVVQEASMAEMDNGVLHAFIDQLQICLGYLHGSITETYFPSLSEEAA